MEPPSAELMRAALENVGKALEIPGGLDTVMQVFVPSKLRAQLPADDVARDAALQFVNMVMARATTFALLAQAVEDTKERVPVQIESLALEAEKQCAIRRETVKVTRKANGLRIAMLPAASNRWWDSQSATLEAEDLDSVLGPESPALPEPKAKRTRGKK